MVAAAIIAFGTVIIPVTAISSFPEKPDADPLIFGFLISM